MTTSIAAQATAQQDAVAHWNAIVPVGTPARFWTGICEVDGKTSRTRTSARVLSGHTALVWVDGESSRIALTHVEPSGKEEAWNPA